MPCASLWRVLAGIKRQNRTMAPENQPKTVQYQSMQSLRIEMRFGDQMLSTGTAFVAQSLAGPLLITNRHNVTGRHQDTGEPLSKSTCGIPDRIVIAHHLKGRLGEWVGLTQPLLSDDGQPLWIEHPTLREKADFVALRLTSIQDVDLYPYDLANPGPDLLIGPSETVSVVGFPLDIRVNGFVPVWATGFVASEPALDVDGLPIFLIDCRTRQGQSGSPVIAYRTGAAVHTNGAVAMNAGGVSRLLGVYSGRVHKDSDLGRVWKAAAILELIRSVRPDFSIGPGFYAAVSRAASTGESA